MHSYNKIFLQVACTIFFKIWQIPTCRRCENLKLYQMVHIDSSLQRGGGGGRREDNDDDDDDDDGDVLFSAFP